MNMAQTSMNETQVAGVAHRSETLQRLREHARNIRRNVLVMARGKGEGYVGQGLDAADILTALYFHEMRFDPKRLDWPDRDRFLLSTGHYSIVLFAALAELGVFAEQELASYGADESRLEMAACETTPGWRLQGDHSATDSLRLSAWLWALVSVAEISACSISFLMGSYKKERLGKLPWPRPIIG